MSKNDNARLIDRWFPVAAVDNACRTREGSGQNEKAIFTWFASRPIAQARAAVLTSVLPDSHDLRKTVEDYIALGDGDAVNSDVLEGIRDSVTLLDCFSGRGIIPLEAARLGIRAEGIDLSPVATLAGRLLADWPFRDWSAEPTIVFAGESTQSDDDADVDVDAEADAEPVQTAFGGENNGRMRLAEDLRQVFAEVERRVERRVAQWFPRTSDGHRPWGYLWTTTIPCDGCKKRFPLVGSYVLRHPYVKTADSGQSFSIEVDSERGTWSVVIESGVPTKTPTFVAPEKRQGKSGRCPFCGHVHNLATLKAKGFAGEYVDEPLLAADLSQVKVPGRNGRARFVARKIFRNLTVPEIEAAKLDGWDGEAVFGSMQALPDEQIAPGNASTVDATGYGYKTFADLMCRRQALHFAATAHAIRSVHSELLANGVSDQYAAAITSYAAANLCRKLRRATRGARLECVGKPDGSEQNRNKVGDVFVNESGITFAFDFFEVGPGKGPGTWASLTRTTLKPLSTHLARLPARGRAGRFRRASATALPYRDQSIDVIVTDPPYYEMINYADVSDIFYVWLRRCLFDIVPDLFGQPGDDRGLQDKVNEIVVKQGRAADDMRTPETYELRLSLAFSEMRRVLKLGGHLVVVFGHSDPDAWRRLLGALQAAGFVVTAAWPSRTETGNTGVASIRVTVSIGCRVATPDRPVGMGSEVDREVVEAVIERVHQWDTDGLALEDQLMASYGPAMEVYGKYGRVINPDGSAADLDHYLALARRAVRDAMRLRVDELPLETFDAITRFAMFWLRAKGRSEVPKGEARFFAQADELRLGDLRDRILSETKAGFQLRLQDDRPLAPYASMFEVVRRMAYVWELGGMEAVAETISEAGLEASNQHLWAVVGDLATHLPASDKTAKALAGIKRSASSVAMLVGNARDAAKQSDLFDTVEA